MPNAPINNLIAEFMVDTGWFHSQKTDKDLLPTDNWRLITDAEGRSGILYIVFYHSTSGAGEPRHIPNHTETVDQENTLPKLARLHAELNHPRFGPYIALSEVSENNGIVSVRAWNIAGRLTDGVKSFAVAELAYPEFSYPKLGIAP